MDNNEMKREGVSADPASETTQPKPETPASEAVAPEETEKQSPGTKKKKRAFLPRLTQLEKILVLVGVLCLLLSVVCFLIYHHLSNVLDSQKEAERWQGDGDLRFSQITCFLPMNRQIALTDIATFRTAAMKALTEASFNLSDDTQLMLDAWSTSVRLSISSDHGKGEVGVIAVGGSFFDFHPLQLLSGDYIRQTDLMEDRIVLDEEVAWLVYGGTDLAGMEVQLGGKNFVIAGVVAREKDRASQRAFGDDMGFYMRYDALLQIDETAGINCYEFVMADPVEGFARKVAGEKFPIHDGEIVCNSTRYDPWRLLGFAFRYGSRSTHNTGVLYPYWENAARLTEDWASIAVAYMVLLPVFPIVGILVWFFRLLNLGRRKWNEEILPEARDRTEEAIRVQKRKRWERTHGAYEKD